MLKLFFRVGRDIPFALAAWLLLMGGMPSSSSAGDLQLVETEKTISILDNDQTILVYNKVSPDAPAGIDSIYERSGFLHPVCSPSGRVLTDAFAADHPHQQGIFTAWVQTTYQGKPVDFWNLAGKTGRVLHHQVLDKNETDGNVRFEVELIHRRVTEPAVDVLKENWKLTAYPTDGSYRCFDLDLTQTALTQDPLIIEEYHYGGLGMRGQSRWLTSRKADTAGPTLEASGFLNNLGSNRTAGNHQRARWISLWGNIDGKPVSIAVLCHKDNFRAPQKARIHPTKPYFCFAPCVDGEFTIDKDHPYQARYRYLVTDTMPDAKWLDQQWQAWVGE
ncbi:DUF6807 domain-containing protein [Bremerella sp. T1]|uniref:DUF6807 domain-containing protein n=1 Tax=Bremerella sp. TYQ1 TaxID=3119568 RepID=UPI001CCC7304|nr:PmoA family protein [Bremerella volcania]UBM37081.1 PmoA family protein [Bremerella volcania]